MTASKTLPLIVLISIASCASLKEENGQGIMFTGAEHRMIFNGSSLLIDTMMFEANDCSSENRHCLDFQEARLRVEVPKFCEDLELSWFPDANDSWHYIGGEGHDARGYYGIKGSDVFHFVYSPRWGVQAIEYKQNEITHELYLEKSGGLLPCVERLDP